MSAFDHEIFNTLNTLEAKRPAGGLSLEPLDDGNDDQPPDDTGIVRVWDAHNAFCGPMAVHKAPTGGCR